MSKDKYGSGAISGHDDPPDDATPFKGAWSHIQHSIQELTPKLVATAARIADIVAGREQLKTLMSSGFGAKYRSAIVKLETLRAALEKELGFVEQRLEEARATDAVTPPYLPASKVNHGRNAEDHEETPFHDWQMRHRVEAGLLIIAVALALGSSAYTAWANLIGTNLPVFIDNPILPISMACLVPMASFACKTIWHALRSDGARQLFTRVLNTVAVILILIWSGLFADQFHGLGSGAIAGLFDEQSAWESIRETAFTAATLLTEMVIGTVLAHRLDKIAAGYSPNYWVANPDKESIRAIIAELTAARDNLIEQIVEVNGDLASYPESLSLQVELALLSYDARRSRVEDDIL